MSFQFGQFRRSQLDSFLTPLNYIIDNIKTKSLISTAITFVDVALSLRGSNVLTPVDSDGVSAKSYYIRFRVFKQSTPQLIAIKLVNIDKQTNNTQTLKTITVEAGDETDYSTFEMIITPNNTYNQLKFELQRELEDYNTKNDDGTYGRLCKIEMIRLDDIYNIVNYLSTSTNKKELLQIGIQSAPGLLMCINGEEIRVGRSGIYEILNGYKITFIGFIVEPDDKKYFMLDYQY